MKSESENMKEDVRMRHRVGGEERGKRENGLLEEKCVQKQKKRVSAEEQCSL